MNKVTLMGNLVADPTVNYSAAGTPVANFRLATNETWKDKNGKPQKRVEFHRVVFWGKLATVAGEHLRKGRQILLEGKIQYREWTDKEGSKRYSTEIVGRNFEFLGSKPKDSPKDEEPETLAADGMDDSGPVADDPSAPF